MNELIEAIRNKAYNALGIAYNPQAAFVLVARDHLLGAPKTGELSVPVGTQLYWFQGFSGGICYCRDGEWNKVNVIAW